MKKINIGGVKHSYSISSIRLISLVAIVSCHILQYLDLELAWWLNVGVQVFLCISGFLYGQKIVGEISTFYIKRFKKILLPYYIVVLPVIILYFLFARDKVSVAIAGKVLVLNATLSGGGHLWFVATILICYVITPLLESFYKDCNSKGRYIFITVVAVQIAALVCIGFADFYNPAWIGCYILGYALGVNVNKRYISEKALSIIFAVLACMNIAQVYLEYFAKVQVSGTKGLILKGWESYNHVFLGVFIFLVLKRVLDRIQPNAQIRKLLNMTDEYSYEFYLVHQFLILGPFSLMAITPFIGLNILVILIGICIFAILLKKSEKLILRISNQNR